MYHAMGSNSVVNGVVSVGGVYEGLGGRKIPFLRQIINVADGTEDTDAVNLRQLKAVNADVTTDIKALQDGFTVSNAAGEKQNIALGGDTKQNIKFQGEADVYKRQALGSYAQVKGQGATAVGDSSHALESDSTAVGGWAKATAVSSTAVGKDSFAEADRSTALGAYANGRGHNSVSVGEASVAAGHNSIAIGMQSFAYDGSFIDGEEYENLSEEEKTKYFEAQGIDAYFLKDPADGADSKKIADTYVNTAVGSYSKAKKHGSAFGGFSKANGCLLYTSRRRGGNRCQCAAG